ncbi:hypothetical protein SRHO_G00258550 [Serrasalmus rhombeus]
MISWQKNGEDLYEDVELRETLPNQDGTFQKRSVLTVSPEELTRHNYTCIIQHSSLEKEVVLKVSDLRVSGGVWMGIIIGAVVTVLIIIGVGVFVWMKKQQQTATGSVSTSIGCFGQTNIFLKVCGIGRARIRVGFESACQNTGVFERWRTGIQVLAKPSLPYTDLERTCVCGSSAVGYLRKASSLLGHTSFHTLRAVGLRGRREKG